MANTHTQRTGCLSDHRTRLSGSRDDNEVVCELRALNYAVLAILTLSDSTIPSLRRARIQGWGHQSSYLRHSLGLSSLRC